MSYGYIESGITDKKFIEKLNENIDNNKTNAALKGDLDNVTAQLSSMVQENIIGATANASSNNFRDTNILFNPRYKIKKLTSENFPVPEESINKPLSVEYIFPEDNKYRYFISGTSNARDDLSSLV